MKLLAQHTVHGTPKGRTLGTFMIVFGLLVIVILAVLFGASWWQHRLPKFQSGQTAPVTITTPIELTVEDAQSTHRLRQQEAERIPPVINFDPQSAERVANLFLEKYDANQIQFLRRLKQNWETPLGDEQFQSDEFAKFVKEFAVSRSDFPISPALAKRWTEEPQQDELRRETAYQIREKQRQYLIPNQPIPQFARNYSEYWLMPKTEGTNLPNLNQLRERAHPLSARSIHLISDARNDLSESLAGYGADWKAFAAEFLQPNLFFNRELTDSTRHAATNDLVIHKHLSAGDAVITINQPISETQMAAIEKLRQHFAGLNSARQQANAWLLGLGIVSLSLGTLLRLKARQPGHMTIQSTKRDRRKPELTKEETLRVGLLNNMSRWLKERFITRLIAQRQDALDSQSAASAEVEKMNRRLNRLQPEIQKRIANYERRIKDLEKELGESNAVNKELIRTRIKMARKELEIEKAKSNLAWN